MSGGSEFHAAGVQHVNITGLAAARMSGGSEFHAAGPPCEKACSPNLVHSRGVTYLLLEADHRPVHVAALLDVRMMSLRYARHLPVCIPYMIVRCLKSAGRLGRMCCSSWSQCATAAGHDSSHHP